MALRCTRSGGSPTVLELSPDLPVVSEQVAMLTAFGASGKVPVVLAADVEAGADRAGDRPADVERGFSRCQALVASGTTRVLLHGDLHLGNVLDGGARGLVVIDPREAVAQLPKRLCQVGRSVHTAHDLIDRSGHLAVFRARIGG